MGGRYGAALAGTFSADTTYFMPIISKKEGYLLSDDSTSQRQALVDKAAQAMAKGGTGNARSATGRGK